MKPAIKVLFACGGVDRISTVIERLKAIGPELPVEVVSEFAPPEGRWTPYSVKRSFRENLERCRARFRGKEIRVTAMIVDPRRPHWRFRLLALILHRGQLAMFNENADYFWVRPLDASVVAEHLIWRLRSFLQRELRPGGDSYVLFWRVLHPWAFRKPLCSLAAKTAGLAAALLKRRWPADATPLRRPMPAGISVVIRSGNGKPLLQELLPGLMQQSPTEVIVVDNGSNDDTERFLQTRFPDIVVETTERPLSLARAFNRGIRKARYSHICVLNNDMVVEPGFLESLRTAFDEIPDLFCATARILFSEGQPRQETGKVVAPAVRAESDFPIRCELPIDGENFSYVLYGSAGCSLYDAARLRALEGLDETYDPAYIEDLDLGVRAWERGWPTVFASAARVQHRRRATTSRYYSEEELQRMLEIHYLRFLARTISGSKQFLGMWRDAIGRLNLLASGSNPDAAATAALAQAWKAPFWTKHGFRDPQAMRHAFALCCGDVCVTPGAARRPGRRPMILVAAPYMPYPISHGGAVRMFNLMRRAARDFDQVLVSFVNELAPVPPELLCICAEVVTVKRVGKHDHGSTDRPDAVEDFDSPAFHAAVRQTVRKWKPDIAQIEFTQMAQYAADCAPAKTVLVEHDITFDLYKQMAAQDEDWELRRQLDRWIAFETAAWRQVDTVVTMSPKDQAAAPRAHCLPNGVDVERFRPARRPSDPRRLLFIGAFQHLPNILAVDYFLRECWPQLSPRGIKLHIIAGSQHDMYLERFRDRVRADFNQPGIELEGFVADVRHAYERAAIVIAPLVVSAGTNIKILEAMAMGKAVVTTPAGINGLDLASGRDLIVAQSDAEMRAAIRVLLDHPEKRRRIEMQARRTVEQKFDWNAIARDQQRLYEELAGVANSSRYAVR